MHEKLFSIQIFQYFRQILPRVCTLVLFISVGNLVPVGMYIMRFVVLDFSVKVTMQHMAVKRAVGTYVYCMKT